MTPARSKKSLIITILLAMVIVAASGGATVFALHTFVETGTSVAEVSPQPEKATEVNTRETTATDTVVTVNPAETRKTRCYTLVAPEGYTIETVNEADCSATLSSPSGKDDAITIIAHIMPTVATNGTEAPLYTSLAEHHMGVIEKTLSDTKAKITGRQQMSANELKIGHFRYISAKTNNEIVIYVMDSPTESLVNTATNKPIGSFQVTGPADSPEAIASTYLVAKGIRSLVEP